MCEYAIVKSIALYSNLKNKQDKKEKLKKQAIHKFK